MLKAAPTARPSVREALYLNQFTSFPGCQTMECHIYHGSKVYSLEVYSLNGESTIPNTISAATVIDLSAVVSAKVDTAAAKKFEQFSL